MPSRCWGRRSREDAGVQDADVVAGRVERARECVGDAIVVLARYCDVWGRVCVGIPEIRVMTIDGRAPEECHRPLILAVDIHPAEQEPARIRLTERRSYRVGGGVAAVGHGVVVGNPVGIMLTEGCVPALHIGGERHLLPEGESEADGVGHHLGAGAMVTDALPPKENPTSWAGSTAGGVVAIAKRAAPIVTGVVPK